VGSAIETWPTSPVSKKLVGRATVRSMNWSTIAKRPGGNSLTQRADRRDGEDVRRAETLQGIDVSASVNSGRRDVVAGAMTGQEQQAGGTDLTGQDAIGRCPPRRFHHVPLGVRQPLQRIQTRAADDTDRPVRHIIVSSAALPGALRDQVHMFGPEIPTRAGNDPSDRTGLVDVAGDSPQVVVMRFVSDNAATVSPTVLTALAAADHVDAAYDGDALSAQLDAAFSDLFATEVVALWVTTGTALMPSRSRRW